MTITHTPVVAPTGNKTPIVLLTGNLPAPTFDSPRPYDVLSWESEGNEPQELEILLYPKFGAESGLGPLTAAMLPTHDIVQLEIAWSMGAGERATAQEHSTTHVIVDELAAAGIYTRTQAWLPDNGMKFRIACRRMRVRAKVFAYGASFMLVASVQPVIGGRVTPPMPHVSKPADSISGPCLIPYGAREFRIEPGYAPGSWTQFRHPLNFVNPAIRPVNFVNAECFDWRPIPARSNTVVGDEMLCASIIYR